MSNNSEAASGGIGFFGLLAIVFIVLKLLEKIDWSWWWVLSPIWVPFIAFIAILIFVGLGFLGFSLVNSWRKSWRNSE